MDTLEITYRGGVTPDPKQQDAIFFTGYGLIATVSYAGFSVDVFCDGDTKANLLTMAQGEVTLTMTEPSDFIDAGIDSDDLIEALNKQELIDWVNNSWFDLYCYGEHLDCVAHNLGEALGWAETYVRDRRESEKISNGETLREGETV